MTISSNLASGARRALRAAAHHLDPVVMIGDKGLTASVLHEIDIALTSHALIKVRVASDDRAQRIAFMNEICEKLGCASVQHLGKLLVLWRNKEDGSGDDEEAMLDAATISATKAPSMARERGPRAKLPDAGFRRPTDRDPTPRGGGFAKPQAGGFAARKPTEYGSAKSEARGAYSRGSARGSARGSDRGEGYAPRGTGGYARDDARGDVRKVQGAGYKSRSGDFGRGGGASESGFGRSGNAGGYGRMDAGSDNRRYRRGSDAPAPDTRPPREGWAPRNRRGEGRNENSGGFSGGRSRDDTTGTGSGGGFGGRSRNGYTESRSPRGDRTPSGEERWGARGGNTGGAGPNAPKPRARRRLG